MKCPHCSTLFNRQGKALKGGDDADYNNWTITCRTCPECGRHNFVLSYEEKVMWRGEETDAIPGERHSVIVYPRSTGRPLPPPEVPSEYAHDYREACLVLSDSPKASAALSRRFLQNILQRVSQ